MTVTPPFRNQSVAPGPAEEGPTAGEMERAPRRLRVVALSILMIYFLLPFGAGAAEHGERTGPVIYPVSYHEIAFRIGSSLAGHGKPRLSFYHSLLCERPLFYGCRPRLISEEKFEVLSRSLTADGRGRQATILKEKYQEFQLLLLE
jgi:hypothetical protein